MRKGEDGDEKFNRQEEKKRGCIWEGGDILLVILYPKVPQKQSQRYQQARRKEGWEQS